jgi:hypothetical protein
LKWLHLGGFSTNYERLICVQKCVCVVWPTTWEKKCFPWFPRSFQTNYQFAMSINSFACVKRHANGATRALKLLHVRSISARVEICPVIFGSFEQFKQSKNKWFRQHKSAQKKNNWFQVKTCFSFL